MGVTEVDIKDNSIFKWSAVGGDGEMWNNLRHILELETATFWWIGYHVW